MTLNFTVNDASFSKAVKAYEHFQALGKAGIKVRKLRVNSEPMTISDFEDFVKIEMAEKAHNKKQGL